MDSHLSVMTCIGLENDAAVDQLDSYNTLYTQWSSPVVHGILQGPQKPNILLTRIPEQYTPWSSVFYSL